MTLKVHCVFKKEVLLVVILVVQETHFNSTRIYVPHTYLLFYLISR